MIPRWIGLAAAALLFVRLAGAQERLRLEMREDRGPVEIRAEILSAGQTDQKIEARGAVVVSWSGYRLEADHVSYDHLSGVAAAEGSVTLTDAAGNLLRCRSLTVQVDTQQGEVQDGTLFIAREGYQVWGKRFVRTGPNSYTAEEGGFTACDGTWPSWRVWADRVKVELEGYLVARGAAFWVEGVPVLYTPYLVFPVKRERQSGFLIPKGGYSTQDGWFFVSRYYWAFADNADLVARLEYRSRRGWTEAGELRYVLAEGHSGSAELSHLYDRGSGSHRFTVKADHNSQFDPDTRARLHVDYLGDTGFLKDFGDTIDERGVARLESYLLATRDADSGTAFGFAKYIQALDQSQSQVLQTLPSVGLFGRETPLLGPLNWAPDTRFTRFWRAEGLRGERWELDPGFSWGVPAGPIGLAARTGYRQNLYRVDEGTVSHGAAWAETAASALLSRGYGALVHALEPKAVLSWEEEGRGGPPPQFDEADVFDNRAGLALVLESRWLRLPDYAPVAGLEVERRLDFGALRRHGWGEKAFGPWRGEASFTPSARLGLRAEGEYDPSVRYPWLLGSIEGEGADRRGDKLLAGYHYLKGRASYLDGGLVLAMTPVLSLEYRHRHSFRDERTLEESYGLRLAHPCWDLLVAYSRNYREQEDKDERRYYATLQLKGLGKIGTLRGIVP